MEYWPTGTSSLPRAMLSQLAMSAKLLMLAGLPSGTTRATLFSSRFTRVPCSTKSRPSVFTSGSAAASSWFICFWAAEMNRSQSAPSWIWVFRVPEESKLKIRVTLGATA